MRRVLILAAPGCFRDTMERSFRQDCGVIVCPSAERAAVWLGAGVDVLVLSLDLPGEDALDFLEQNRTSLPPVVIVLSPLVSPEVLRLLKAAGVSAVVRIPCTVSAVRRLTEDLK